MYSDLVMSRFVIGVALALSACADHELAKLETVRDEVCACKTIACADAAMAKVPAKNIESTHKSQKVAREMLDCLADVYETNRPTLDPDAEP